MLKEVQENMERHNKNLSSYACKDEKAIRFQEEKNDIRTPYFRDIDRILYTYAYIRYMDKTQVFTRAENDHITKRSMHVQYVSKIARTIGRALGLNEDLIEAASLGHDIGHVPFGHFGESVLSKISQSVGEGYFNHNVESVRQLMYIENHGDGENLTLQVLDAILCHNGELPLGVYQPKEKTKEKFLQEYQDTYTKKDGVSKLIPMTLEGCVVRISDIIAYLGKDIDDACMLGIISKEEIPNKIKETLGTRNRDIVNTIVLDIIKNSIGKPYIKMSEEVYQAIVELKKFNYIHIYDKSLSEEQKEKVKEMFKTLFTENLENIKKNRKNTKIYTHFLNFKNEKYQSTTSDERKVIDFIAGMTDEYFINCYKEIKNENLGYTKGR